MTKEYFHDKQIDYTEKDISSDAEAFTFVVDKIGQAVTPVITIGNHVVVGFDRPKIDEALAAEGWHPSS